MITLSVRMYIYLISLLLGALIYVTSQQQIANVDLFVGMQKFFFHASAWGRQYCQYFAGAPFARFCMLNCQERVGGGGQWAQWVVGRGRRDRRVTRQEKLIFLSAILFLIISSYVAFGLNLLTAPIFV